MEANLESPSIEAKGFFQLNYHHHGFYFIIFLIKTKLKAIKFMS